jgi:hypothetical protein
MFLRSGIGNPGKLSKLLSSGADCAELARYLDGLRGPERVIEAIGVRGKWVRRLYEAVASAPPLAIDELVPPSAPASATFIFEGRNSLPLFSRFQKRLARATDGRVIGHNAQPWSPLTGPGYFELKPPSGSADVPGEPYLDYTVPPGYEPTGWPHYRPNEWGPSLFVFARLKDYLRRVSTGVVVGKAFRNGSPQGQYFVLARAEN